MFIVDASVLIANLLPLEPYHAEARVCMTRLSQSKIRLACPTVALSEVAAGIARTTGRPALAERAVANLRSNSQLRFIAVDDSLIDRAALIAARQRVRGCDAIYIALAEDRRVPLITLDHEQRDRSPASVVAMSPADALRQLRR